MSDPKDPFTELADAATTLHRDWIMGIPVGEEQLKRPRNRLEGAHAELSRLRAKLQEREEQVARAEAEINKHMGEGV